MPGFVPFELFFSRGETMSDLYSFLDAIRAGEKEQVLTMLAEKQDLALTTTEGGVSVVMLAVYYGQWDLARAIAAGKHELSFHEAVTLGELDQVTRQVHAEPVLANQLSPDGYPPLGLAAFFGQMAAMDVLLANGADPNITANNQMRVTPLHSAVANSSSELAEAMAQRLMEHGAHPNVVQQGGWTPLHEVANRNMLKTAELLLSHGADPTIANDDGTTSIDLARQQGYLQMADLLGKAKE
jgi:uncharacterized protein